MGSRMEKLKKKWNISSNRDFTLIMLVFSLSGMGVLFSRRWLFALLGLNHAAHWVQITARIFLFIPLYQLSTLFFGLLLGQFNFFWGRQKAMGRAIRKAFTPRSKRVPNSSLQDV